MTDTSYFVEESSPFPGWQRLRLAAGSVRESDVVASMRSEGHFVSPLLEHPEYGPAVVREAVLNVSIPFREWERYFEVLVDTIENAVSVRVLTSPLGTELETFEYFSEVLAPFPVEPPRNPYDGILPPPLPDELRPPINEDGFVVFAFSVENTCGFELFDRVEDLAALGFIDGADPAILIRMRSAMPAPFGWPPNDPMLGNAWHLQYWNNNGLDIQNAWTRTYGYSSVRVAIIDGGVQSNHPDLHLGPGRNFADDKPASDYEPGSQWDNHGTTVAGVVSAYANNDYLAAGVAPNVQSIPLRIGRDHDGQGGFNGSFAWIVDALNWGGDEGCRVSNMSIGFPSNSSVSNTLANLRSTKRMVHFAATGNAGDNVISYPASNSNVIAVGSTNSSGVRSSFSNYGNGMGVVAPGESILTTDRSAPHGYHPYEDFVYISGTSFASPAAAALAALIVSRNPRLDADEVQTAIFSTARNLGSSFEYGHGLIRPADALDAVDEGLWIRAGAVDVSNTWKFHHRFNYVSDAHFPIFHHNHHGWQSAATDDPSSFQFYDFSMQRWWWTNFEDAVYPYMRVDGTTWYFYDEGSKNPRLFYDIANGEWVTEHDI